MKRILFLILATLLLALYVEARGLMMVGGGAGAGTTYFGYQTSKATMSGESYSTGVNSAIYYNALATAPVSGPLTELCSYVKSGAETDGHDRPAIYASDSPATLIAQCSAERTVSSTTASWLCCTAFTNAAGTPVTPSLTATTTYRLAYAADTTDVNIGYTSCTTDDMRVLSTEFTSGWPAFLTLTVGWSASTVCRGIIAGIN